VRHGFATVNLTDGELAGHMRHMVGGRLSWPSTSACRFIFPERPGALMRFLSALHPSWNISLFHYRNQGADYGRILVGIQVPQRPGGVRRVRPPGLPLHGRNANRCTGSSRWTLLRKH
jgi:threonine dehydratase